MSEPTKALFLVVSEAEFEKMHEAHEADRLRVQTLSDSLVQTKRRLQDKRALDECARRSYDEAILCLAEDDDDDFATELEKREKLERIEAEFIQLGRVYHNAVVRVGWELKEAEKAGLNLR